VVICRAGEPPPGADEAVCEVGGGVLLVGEGTRLALGRLTCARRAWLWETAPGLRPGALSRELAALLTDCALVVLPGSADGRDLAPRLAAELNRPLLAGATRVAVTAGPRGEEVSAVLSRLDGRLEVPVRCPSPAVATLLPGAGSSVAAVPEFVLIPAPVSAPASVSAPAFGPDVEVLEVLEPDPSTMDLADATRVLAAGAGLIRPGTGEVAGTAVFDLLVGVAAALRASAGATRVVTDAGWAGVERQIGTTGVSVEPMLYLAFGISGATQHIGGIGAPAQVISINTDASCPMTAMATLGLVADAPAVLRELAARLGVAVPDPAREALESTEVTA
jgi:electron transfer flavoprotein alpha subunit